MKTSLLFACMIASFVCAVANADEPLSGNDIREMRGDAASIPPEFDWPADPVTLWKISGGVKRPDLRIPGKVDTPAQREHGWNLFAGVTSPSKANDMASLPVFMTWYTGDETFAKPGRAFIERANFLAVAPSTQFLLSSENAVRSILREQGIDTPERFDPDFSELTDPKVLAMLEAHQFEGAVFSQVAFNRDLHEFIRAKGYFRKSKLGAIADKNKVRVPINTPPTRSVSLKLGWWPVAQTGVTPLPVWDFKPRYPGDAKNLPMTWKRVVAVDPKNTSGPVAKLKLGKFTHTNPKVVPLDRFFAVQLDDVDIAVAESNWRVKKAAIGVLGRPLRAGDYLVLTALHINTREFEPWVFTSFWWHDEPTKGRYSENRIADVKGVWSNYLMGVSYNINKPREDDGGGKIVYNPWLELFQKGGTTSSCMSCHARAAYSPYFRVSPAFNPKILGTTDPNGFTASPSFPNDSAFRKGTVFLDAVWTLHTRSIKD